MKILFVCGDGTNVKSDFDFVYLYKVFAMKNNGDSDKEVESTEAAKKQTVVGAVCLCKSCNL